MNGRIGRLALPGKRFGAEFLDLLVPMVAMFLIFVGARAGAATGAEGGTGVGVFWGIALFFGTSFGRSRASRTEWRQARSASA